MGWLRSSRFAALVPLGVVTALVWACTRAALVWASRADADTSALALAKVFALGSVYDLMAFAWFALPCAVALALVPARFWGNALSRGLVLGSLALAAGGLLFLAVVEWYFWDEFTARFNFLAVDYLIYTKELTGNAQQAYPLGAVIGSCATLGLATLWASARWLGPSFASRASWRQRLAVPALLLLGAVLGGALGQQSWADALGNRNDVEASKNGPASFMAAFVANGLDYDRFYRRLPDEEVQARLRALLDEPGTRLEASGPWDTTRAVAPAAPPRPRLNVMLLLEESLSADYLAAFGGSGGLTPCLDALSREGLAFTRCYATGNRTVRGLEAVVLSLPPTPGSAVVRRSEVGEGLDSLAFVLADLGYETSFIYSGYGFFDNMNRFCEKNGFQRIVDRSDLGRDEIRHATIWGVCDQDLYARALREADQSFARGKPFFQLVLGTSNHRPYTYPQVIDIPSGSSRQGAVKYADFAVGELVATAKSRPWFDDTLFVVVADHCASSAGKTSLPVNRYHVPLLLYAPRHVQPGVVDALCSQMDVAPTVLGVLGAGYRARFLGHDVRAGGPPRAFVATYQEMGFWRGDTMAVLKPNQSAECFAVSADGSVGEPRVDDGLVRDAIVYYQGASHLVAQHLYGRLSAR